MTHWNVPRDEVPAPTYERAARLWNQGLDTAAIATELWVSEAMIWNAMGIIREIAADQRRGAA